MNNTTSNTSTPRRPDCVTKVHMGGTVLVVSGYFKQDATATAADKMIRVLKAEIADVSRNEMYQNVKCDNPRIKNSSF